jgi:hypothetical protein
MLECLAAFVALNTLPIVFPLALKSKDMNHGKHNGGTVAKKKKERFSLTDDDNSSSFNEEEEDEHHAASGFDEIPFLNAWLLCGANPGQVYE